MDLLQKIIECKEEEIDSIVEQYIKEADNSAQKVEMLGFLDFSNANTVFKGFIPLKTRIKYASMSIEDYGMDSTDFIYEFAHFIKRNNIKSTQSLIYSLESFVNAYFGYPGKASREVIFNDIALKTTTTDDEYFAALANNKIGDLKGKGAALCTERSALVQQILNIFGIETYYCIGCVDLGDRQEAHCFNISKTQNGYALLDYSLATTAYNQEGVVKGYLPFVATLTNEEFLDFVNNGTIKEFDNYFMKGKEKAKTGTQRMYVVGEYKIVKENETGKGGK